MAISFWIEYFSKNVHLTVFLLSINYSTNSIFNLIVEVLCRLTIAILIIILFLILPIQFLPYFVVYIWILFLSCTFSTKFVCKLTSCRSDHNLQRAKFVYVYDIPVWFGCLIILLNYFTHIWSFNMHF